MFCYMFFYLFASKLFSVNNKTFSWIFKNSVVLILYYDNINLNYLLKLVYLQ